VRLEENGSRLVLDPGTFSEAAEALDGAAAVMITHEHVDHLDEEAITTALQNNGELCLWAPNSVTPLFAAFGERVITVEPGQTLDVAGFRVTTHGGQHALIHPRIPLVKNIGYVINECVYHPGDSFIVPNVAVRYLLVPIHAPWSKFAEVVDFLISVRPERASQIHDGLLNDLGIRFVENNIGRVIDGFDITFTLLTPHESVEV
jgi:L-ascorbate metabolism protein UlaG (beta-lactamase superfamily)